MGLFGAPPVLLDQLLQVDVSGLSLVQLSPQVLDGRLQLLGLLAGAVADEGGRFDG